MRARPHDPLTRRLATAGVILVALSFAITLDANAATSGKAPRIVRLAPPIPCTAANRMDVFIDEDNIMWACECEQLRTGVICRWQVIGGVDPVKTRKRVPRHHPVRVVAFAKAGVIA